MKEEEMLRLKENPAPTEEELYMGAFTEWIETGARRNHRNVQKRLRDAVLRFPWHKARATNDRWIFFDR